MQDDQQQFDALCFLHACGKTSAAEAAWMETMLARHPHWRARLEQERLLVTQARAAAAQLQQDAPPLVSFEQVLATLAAAQPMPQALTQPTVQPQQQPQPQPAAPPTVQPQPQPQPAAPPAAPGPLARLQAWWRRPVPGGLAYAVMALLVLGVSLQSWRLTQWSEPDGGAARYRGQPAVGAAGAAATAQLKVVFDDRASAGAIRLALHQLGLNIVHGPDAQGAYLLATGHGDAALAAQQLLATGLVLDALPLAAPRQ